MRAAMLDHGLDAPHIETQDGYFQVILTGPGDDLKRLRVPDGAGISIVPPSMEEKLNDRQKKILQRVMKEGYVTSGWCRSKLNISYNTAFLDLKGLVELGILVQTGEGRNTRYVPKK